MGTLKNIKFLKAEARGCLGGVGGGGGMEKSEQKVQCFTQTEEITSRYLFHSLVTVDYS